MPRYNFPGIQVIDTFIKNQSETIRNTVSKVFQNCMFKPEERSGNFFQMYTPDQIKVLGNAIVTGITNNNPNVLTAVKLPSGLGEEETKNFIETGGSIEKR